MNKLIELLTRPWQMWQAKQSFKKRMDELRKRDPFIYK